MLVTLGTLSTTAVLTCALVEVARLGAGIKMITTIAIRTDTVASFWTGSACCALTVAAPTSS